MQEFFNISVWKYYGVNYWGIPKCANTSVKYALAGIKHKEEILNSYKQKFSYVRYFIEFKSTDKWVHDPIICEYVSKESAVNNGLENITLIRNPIERFKSQFKYNQKIGILSLYSVDDLLDHMEETRELDRNIHFKSQAHFISDNYVLLPTLVFKTEQIEKLEKYLSISIPKINTIDRDILLSKNQIKRIESIFSADFEIYEAH